MNKKIIGAEIVFDEGKKFRSKLEHSCYNLLVESELEFEHEPLKFILWEGKKLQNVIVYSPDKKGPGKYGKDMTLQERKLVDITYTPDFIIKKTREKESFTIYVDVKGKENDVYPLKKKMFLEQIDLPGNYFFEPHSVRQMKDVIKFIEEL